jgi:hypothetical protein
MSHIQTLEHLPIGRRGTAEINRETPSRFACMVEAIHGRRLSERPVTRLLVNGNLLMSDGDNEIATNADFVRRAHGHVLIAGLGLGLILKPIISSKAVASLTVIEKYRDVVELVHPHYRCPKLIVMCADIFDWRPAKGTLYNVIYFDIWGDMNTDNLSEMARLHRSFAKYLDRSDPKCWMTSWEHGQLLARRRRGD